MDPSSSSILLAASCRSAAWISSICSSRSSDGQARTRQHAVCSGEQRFQGLQAAIRALHLHVSPGLSPAPASACHAPCIPSAPSLPPSGPHSRLLYAAQVANSISPSFFSVLQVEIEACNAHPKKSTDEYYTLNIKGICIYNQVLMTSVCTFQGG